MNFLMGGGFHPWGDDQNPCCVNLVIDGEVERTATGTPVENGNESMTRREWDVAELKGKTAKLVVVDQNGDGWDIRILTMSIRPTQAETISLGIGYLLLRHAES